ncbi:hypothetical protein M427DRAFT_56895 [Gonapodya prolifera JEL478]|uniref:SnoaL-like domain-containing protein n=1 Tax=Gonapodya prolifera (strain JEL478) TaxID=1344416 RepID=A0A139AER0_GONPJ|nr:hypothetical protein M427DRAFT_56895 [Gonapodya prolifera JEL478]|eukprot:KXS15267.1 hypothetical protein M427DRAFT_56895 [Gonapodya prolifera JEL478]
MSTYRPVSARGDSAVRRASVLTRFHNPNALGRTTRPTAVIGKHTSRAERAAREWAEKLSTADIEGVLGSYADGAVVRFAAKKGGLLSRFPTQSTPFWTFLGFAGEGYKDFEFRSTADFVFNADDLTGMTMIHLTIINKKGTAYVGDALCRIRFDTEGQVVEHVFFFSDAHIIETLWQECFEMQEVQAALAAVGMDVTPLLRREDV